jgi:hypothetical protein
VEETPAIAISLGESATTLAQGGTGTSTVALTRTNYSGDVALTLSGLPAGVSAAFDAATLSGSTASSTITFAASKLATPGTATVTVTATGAGVTAATTTLALAVTVTGTYALSATSANIFAGSSGPSSVTITRTGGFAQNVDLAVSGLPSGVTASFAPPSAGGNSSVLTLSASAGAATGSSIVTVRGTTPGLPEQTATLTLTVYTPTPISIDFCAGRLTWAAYKNEGADWVALTPDANNTVSFTATPKVAFASVEPSGSFFSTRVRYLSAEELKKLSDLPCQEVTLANRTATVTGLSGLSSDHAYVAAERNQFIANNRTISPLWPAGPADVVAGRETGASGGGSSSFWNADRVAIRRDVDLTMPVTFDVNDPEFLNPTPMSYSVSGISAGETTNAQLLLFTKAYLSNDLSTRARIWTPQAAAPASATIPAVPVSLLVSTDLQEFTFNTQSTSGLTFTTRTVISTFKDPVDQALSLGAAPTTPSFTELTTSGAVRYRAQAASQADYASLVSLVMSQTARNSFTVDYSAAFQGSTPGNWDVSIPDLTAVAGWSSAWNLEFGRSTALAWTSFSAVAFDYKFRRQWEPGVVRSALVRQVGITP